MKICLKKIITVGSSGDSYHWDISSSAFCSVGHALARSSAAAFSRLQQPHRTARWAGCSACRRAAISSPLPPQAEWEMNVSLPAGTSRWVSGLCCAQSNQSWQDSLTQTWEACEKRPQVPSGQETTYCMCHPVAKRLYTICVTLTSSYITAPEQQRRKNGKACMPSGSWWHLAQE